MVKAVYNTKVTAASVFDKTVLRIRIRFKIKKPDPNPRQNSGGMKAQKGTMEVEGSGRLQWG
jgi:hypothetical protein